MEMADFTILPYDAYFVFGRGIITSFSFFPPYLVLGKALRGVAIFYGSCFKFLHAVVDIDIQNGLIGINSLTFYCHDAHTQRQVLQRTAEVLFRQAQRFERSLPLGLGMLTLGDVDCCTLSTDHCSIFINSCKGTLKKHLFSPFRNHWYLKMFDLFPLHTFP